MYVFAYIPLLPTLMVFPRHRLQADPPPGNNGAGSHAKSRVHSTGELERENRHLMLYPLDLNLNAFGLNLDLVGGRRSTAQP